MLEFYTALLVYLFFLASQWFNTFKSFSNLHFLGLTFFTAEMFFGIVKLMRTARASWSLRPYNGKSVNHFWIYPDNCRMHHCLVWIRVIIIKDLTLEHFKSTLTLKSLRFNDHLIDLPVCSVTVKTILWINHQVSFEMFIANCWCTSVHFNNV